MPYSTYSNPHYLATFTALVLPVICFYVLLAKAWFKLPLIIIALMAADLLLGTGSRPAFLGLIIGSLLVLLFLTGGKWKWIGTGAVCGAIALIVVSGYDDMGTRMAALITDLQREERIELWTNSWLTLKENSVAEWLWGHGIKWSTTKFHLNANAPPLEVVFPHLHFLEILYLNGISGVLLIFGGLLSVWVATLVNTFRSQSNFIRLLGKCMTVVFIIWLFSCGLVYPFYSKYSIYPLTFLLSVMLLLTNRHRRPLS